MAQACWFPSSAPGTHTWQFSTHAWHDNSDHNGVSELTADGSTHGKPWCTPHLSHGWRFRNKTADERHNIVTADVSDTRQPPVHVTSELSRNCSGQCTKYQDKSHWVYSGVVTWLRIQSAWHSRHGLRRKCYRSIKKYNYDVIFPAAIT